ncbi:putative prp 4 c domain-containing protein [Rosellinia necatrix]|uniref:Putative prp 4 c domain-containing protein n=1 Tax=Rosellinia necatrix TaxID=77044 RepID=A0A1W2TED6_ROSNE|nr:putative prp 4 c domain-containing protein [Rosellinia necatrix]
MRSALCTLLALGLAGQALAEPPREPKFARMSTRDIFGLNRRAVEGYAPTEQLCGAGDTCAQACGKGFRQCASKDDETHCYNRSKQTCCPGGTGDSCDSGYFCSADDNGKTWCCPEGLSLEECAEKYHIPGSLTSEAPSTSTSTSTTKTGTKTKTSTATDTSTDVSATTTESVTTSTKSRKPESTKSSTITNTTHNLSTTKSQSEETGATPSSSMSTTTLVIDITGLLSPEGAGAQTTALDPAVSSTPSTTAPASSPTNSIGASGSDKHKPVSKLVLFIAGAFAALV